MTEAYYDPDAQWGLIPEHMHDGVRRYVMNGEAIGGFLTAIMANDFMESAIRADHMNLVALQGWATFLYNSVPASGRGSREIVKAWQAAGGINGGAR